MEEKIVDEIKELVCRYTCDAHREACRNEELLKREGAALEKILKFAQPAIEKIAGPIAQTMRYKDGICYRPNPEYFEGLRGVVLFDNLENQLLCLADQYGLKRNDRYLLLGDGNFLYQRIAHDHSVTYKYPKPWHTVEYVMMSPAEMVKRLSLQKIVEKIRDILKQHVENIEYTIRVDDERVKLIRKIEEVFSSN